MNKLKEALDQVLLKHKAGDELRHDLRQLLDDRIKVLGSAYSVCGSDSESKVAMKRDLCHQAIVKGLLSNGLMEVRATPRPDSQVTTFECIVFAVQNWEPVLTEAES